MDEFAYLKGNDGIRWSELDSPRYEAVVATSSGCSHRR